jgi:hypothetical protein
MIIEVYIMIPLMSNGSLRSYIPTCPDFHSVALRLHLLFALRFVSSSLPSVVFPWPYSFLAWPSFSRNFFLSIPLLRCLGFSMSNNIPAIDLLWILLSLPPHAKWLSAVLHSDLSRFPLCCLAASFAFCLAVCFFVL